VRKGRVKVTDAICSCRHEGCVGMECLGVGRARPRGLSKDNTWHVPVHGEAYAACVYTAFVFTLVCQCVYRFVPVCRDTDGWPASPAPGDVCKASRTYCLSLGQLLCLVCGASDGWHTTLFNLSYHDTCVSLCGDQVIKSSDTLLMLVVWMYLHYNIRTIAPKFSKTDSDTDVCEYRVGTLQKLPLPTVAGLCVCMVMKVACIVVVFCDRVPVCDVRPGCCVIVSDDAVARDKFSARENSRPATESKIPHM
jgi:hypothetical protein